MSRKMSWNKRTGFLVVQMAMGLLIGSPVWANTVTWTQTTPGAYNWSTIGNWSGNIPPTIGGGDDVQFTSQSVAGNVTSTVDTDWTVNSLTFNAGSTNGNYIVTTAAGVTLNLAGGTPLFGGGVPVGIRNLSGRAHKLISNATGAIHFTASQAIIAGNGNIYTDGGNWTSAPGVLVTLANNNSSSQIQFYGGSTPAGFQGSFAQVGSTLLNMDNVTQYSRLGTHTFHVSSLDTVNGSGTTYGYPILILNNSTTAASGTLANAFSFSNMTNASAGRYQIRGPASAIAFTINLTGDWSGDIGGGNDSSGGSGVNFTSSANITNTNLRFRLTGNNSGLTSSTANKDTSKFPFHVARGLLVVDSDDALGASNGLLVGVGSALAAASQTSGLLAANGRTINSVIRVRKNDFTTPVSQNVILGVDGTSASATFAGDIFLDSDANAGRVPNLQLTAPTGSAAAFNGNIQNQGAPAANVVPVSITGGGIVSLNGTNTYSGPTTVTAGTTLGGIGSLTSALTVNGILAPGNSIGTLTVGNTTFGTGGSFDVELGAGLSDLLVVNGNLDIASAILNLSGIADNVTSYVITTYTGSLTGPFSNVTGLPAGYTLDYGSGSASQITLLVPEPATLALIGLGSVLVFARRRSAK